jgi:hypothetical protein
MKSRLTIGWILLLVATVIATHAAMPAMTERPKEMLGASLKFSDAAWDQPVGLLWSTAPGEERHFHRVRESTWYALGLLMRNESGDDARALALIRRVLSFQYSASGQPWDGTFRRAPEEAEARSGARLWKDFDPNWRQFIGTTFAIILEQHEARLPAELRAQMLEAIRRAVEGELTQGRAEPYHTNIKLMHGFLVGWAGRRLGRAAWVEYSEKWITGVRTEFAEHQTFDEYNSPTYYGVDFYGLALCRCYGATESIRTAATEMEAGLWRDVGRFYHAGLKNMCGPFDRAYGLDMRRYVSLTGVWMGLVLPSDVTPLPDPSQPMDHGHDFGAVPLYVALGARVPAEVLDEFLAFKGERTLERIITPERTATAWLSDALMIGGEITHRTREAGPTTRYQQFVPATIHWRMADHDVGAIAVRICPPVDARASAGELAITTERGDTTFRILAAGADTARIEKSLWRLPNLQIAIETDAAEMSLEHGSGFVEVTYHAATRVELCVKHEP